MGRIDGEVRPSEEVSNLFRQLGLRCARRAKKDSGSWRSFLKCMTFGDTLGFSCKGRDEVIPKVVFQRVLFALHVEFAIKEASRKMSLFDSARSRPRKRYLQVTNQFAANGLG